MMTKLRFFQNRPHECLVLRHGEIHEIGVIRPDDGEWIFDPAGESEKFTLDEAGELVEKLRELNEAHR